MKLPLSFAAALLLISTSSLATPTVIGNTISWPDDGWYQVQLIDGPTIVEVCAGGRECDVLPGKYIVINHTTGDRHTGVAVLDTEEPTDSENPINVAGNTISWPDDGWYQVQQIDGPNIVEVCAGGRECDVTPGEYIVINHTTGDRYIGVTVLDTEEPVDSENPINVAGNTISWPEDGWYQVQLIDGPNIVEVCAGGRECDVLPGEYIVINHTTGQRVEGVLVSAPEPEEIDPLACNESLSNNHLTLDCFSAENGLNVSYSILENTRSPFVDDVNSAGDFNGDGYPDMLVRVGNSVESGAVILLGSAEGWNTDIVLNDPTNVQVEAMNQNRVVRFNSDYAEAYHIGDINADGYSDIGFPYDEEVRIIFGRENAGAQTYSVAQDSTDIGFIIKSESERTLILFSTSITPAGDFNGDGIDDFLLAADIYPTFNEANRVTTGALFIIYGRNIFEPVVALESLTSSDAKIFLPGDPSNRFADKSTGIGDVDADGFDDVLFSDKGTGNTYLVYGGEAIDDFQYRLNDPSVPNMTRLVNSSSTLDYVYKGRAVTGGGDFNGDGFADFAIMEENTPESINIVFGRAERLPGTYDVNTENTLEGFTVGDVSENVWTGAFDLTEDINGDGLADLIIGSETTDTYRGAVYIVFGTTDNKNRQFGDTSDDGTQLITGLVEYSSLGRSVHALGDINGDGIGDFSVGLEFDFETPRQVITIFGAVK